MASAHRPAASAASILQADPLRRVENMITAMISSASHRSNISASRFFT